MTGLVGNPQSRASKAGKFTAMGYNARLLVAAQPIYFQLYRSLHEGNHSVLSTPGVKESFICVRTTNMVKVLKISWMSHKSWLPQADIVKWRK